VCAHRSALFGHRRTANATNANRGFAERSHWSPPSPSALATRGSSGAASAPPVSEASVRSTRCRWASSVPLEPQDHRASRENAGFPLVRGNPAATSCPFRDGGRLSRWSSRLWPSRTARCISGRCEMRPLVVTSADNDRSGDAHAPRRKLRGRSPPTITHPQPCKNRTQFFHAE
jgi:hypothetical protein